MLESLLAFFGFGPDPKTSVTCVRKSPADTKAAIVFVHGFTGGGATTWTELLPRIEAQGNLDSWDIYTITYATSLSLDISELWAADANLKTLGQRLATDLAQTALAPYDALVLIAHSMGGLVVQKALVDYPTLVRRTRCVILLGTPSDGLKKSSGAASPFEASARGYGLGQPLHHGAARGLASEVRRWAALLFPYRRRREGPVRPAWLLACAVSRGTAGGCAGQSRVDAFAGGG